MSAPVPQFASFKEFYPYYLGEHRDAVCRRLHFVGSSVVLLLVALAVWRAEPVLLWWVPVAGYGCAWIGHFFFEHNRPATFRHPLYSLLGDWVMYRDMLTGKVAW
jgi:hypothetical protein